MRKLLTVALLAAAFSIPASAQDKKPQQMTVMNEELGLSLTKPNDEKWKVSADGKWYGDCKVHAEHVIDDLGIDAHVQPGTNEYGKGWGPIKDIGDDVIKRYEENLKGKDGKDPAWKEFKILKRDDRAKFPGGGGNQGFFVKAQFTDQGDGKKEIHQWLFIRNNNLYYFVVYGAPGEYDKKARDMQFIIQNFKIFKMKKAK